MRFLCFSPSHSLDLFNFSSSSVPSAVGLISFTASVVVSGSLLNKLPETRGFRDVNPVVQSDQRQTGSPSKSCPSGVCQCQVCTRP
mmetsp:Transcript_47175/g.100963  ORF Transcript_47175/g.100963 Transcript_47175/m.100963 type:complete len:86 (+) Transcript_47175:304-561(+)